MGLFSKATRKKSKLRLALCGTSGSGKTYSSLLIAKGIGGKIALIDTENKSASLYEGIADFDVAEISPPFTVEKYISAIKEAELAGYDTLIIDSLTHAWAGQGGLLEEVDKRNSSGKGNSFTAWREVTPMQNKLIDSILQSSMHVIVTMRTKTAYELEKNDKGKVIPVKKGMAPIQREGLEYEFTAEFDMDNEKHVAIAGKDRTGLFDGKIFIPDEETGKTLAQWLDSGVDAPATKQQKMDMFHKSQKISLSVDDMKEIMQLKYNIKTSDELTMLQATDMTNNLEKYWENVIKSKSTQNDDEILDASINKKS